MTTVDPTDPSSYIPTASVVAIDPNHPIEQDLPCRSCGYNLRSQSMGGRCPECNALVEISTRSDLMRFADPQWLKQLSWGAWIISGATIASFIWMFLSYLPIYPTARAGSRFWVSFGISSFIATLRCIGWWSITQSDPTGLRRSKYQTSRQLVRISLAFVVMEQLIYLFSWISPTLNNAQVLILVFMGLELLFVIANIPKYDYLAKLAEQIPDDRLHLWGKRFRLIVPLISGIILVFGQVINFLLRHRNASLATARYWPIYSFLELTNLVLEIVLLVFMIIYGRRINAQRMVAMRLLQSG